MEFDEHRDGSQYIPPAAADLNNIPITIGSEVEPMTDRHAAEDTISTDSIGVDPELDDIASEGELDDEVGTSLVGEAAGATATAAEVIAETEPTTADDRPDAAEVAADFPDLADAGLEVVTHPGENEGPAVAKLVEPIESNGALQTHSDLDVVDTEAVSGREADAVEAQVKAVNPNMDDVLPDDAIQAHNPSLHTAEVSELGVVLEQPPSTESIVIPTQRPGVILRQFTPGDAEALSARANPKSGDGVLLHYLHETKWTYKTPESTAQRISAAEGNEGNRRLLLGIWGKGELAGEVYIKPFNEVPGSDVVEYWISKESRGQGLAYPAVHAACKYSLEVRGAAAVYAAVVQSNAASLRVIGRVGFTSLPQKDWYRLTKEDLDGSI